MAPNLIKNIMDPQKTLENIFQAMEDKDEELFNESFIALYDWLRKGGFPPVCNSLGTTRVKTDSGYIEQPRKIIINHDLAMDIQCVHTEDLSQGYEFVAFNTKDEIIARYPLLQSA